MSRVTRICATCEESFGIYSKCGPLRTKCPACRPRAIQRFCQDCSVELPLGRRKRCDSCSIERERARDRSRSAARHAAKEAAANSVILCEGCGVETRRGRAGCLPFCPACNRFDDRYKKDRSRGSSPAWMMAKARADAAARKPPPDKRYDRHVRQWRRRLRRIDEARERPWMHPDLSAAERWRARYSADQPFLIAQRIRHRLRKSARLDRHVSYTLRKLLKGERRRSPLVEAVTGATGAVIAVHLERQFSRGMTWERFHAGEIHIDHIRPLSSFDLTKESEVRAAWALANLRPMWATENIRKGAAVTHLL